MTDYDLSRLAGCLLILILVSLVLAEFAGVGEVSNARVRIILQFAALLLFGREAANFVSPKSGQTRSNDRSARKREARRRPPRRPGERERVDGSRPNGDADRDDRDQDQDSDDQDDGGASRATRG